MERERQATDQVYRLLRERFGFQDFVGQQLAIIEHILQGKNALVLMPTGAGKSLCFQLPSLALIENFVGEKRPLALVISPLIALMKDQVDALNDRGIAAAFINSSLDSRTRNERYAAIGRGKVDLLYVTPERFRKDEFWDVLESRSVCLLVIDEAHCVSEWGHDFRPDYSRVGEMRERLGNPTTIALTATATPPVQADILRQLNLDSDSCRTFADGINRPNLRLAVIDVWGREEKIEHMCRLLSISKKRDDSKDRPRDSEVDTTSGSSIIYFTLIKTLESFSIELAKLGLVHDRYHGDLDRGERRRVQDRFMEGEVPCVLATNAFGMGIDKPDIRAIIHAEVPGSLEAYYQEIGRAGRDGKPASCTLLYEQADLATQVEFLKWSNPDADYYHRIYDLLRYDTDRVRAFGIDWLREKLSAKNRSDRRLETALGMLRRYDVIADEEDLSSVTVSKELPEVLCDSSTRADKLLSDQRKLYAIVEYAKCQDKAAFLEGYFVGKPAADQTDL